MKGTKEYYELRDCFERYVMSSECQIYFGCKIVRAPVEAKHFYENGKLNEAFIMYMAGYSYGKLNND